ncbi:unnamed protein product [Rotaria magnacalcarata]|uniref:Uncharacterized protein n=1 Tax=Rotaria magnacalcarata TaxID=392030 RepID=A0A816XE09_9BILA|nr:unnamed protein product [Rotaria magnacalcarata]CAF2145035.1 unnamed protein product [Rotaria magnacalcarata]
MAHRFDSQAPGGARKTCTNSNALTFDDDFEALDDDQNDFENNYPVVQDIPFYKRQHVGSYSARSNQNRSLDAIKIYFFDNNNDDFELFWKYEGKTIRGNQRRGRVHRNKQTNISAHQQTASNVTTSPNVIMHNPTNQAHEQ